MWGGDGAAEFFSGFDPYLNDDFHAGESFLVSLSVRGAAGGKGSRTTIVPRANGVFDPHTGVKSASEFLRAGSFSCATGFQTASAPCQRPYHGTRSACSVAVVSIPIAARPSAD